MRGFSTISIFLILFSITAMRARGASTATEPVVTTVLDDGDHAEGGTTNDDEAEGATADRIGNTALGTVANSRGTTVKLTGEKTDDKNFDAIIIGAAIEVAEKETDVATIIANMKEASNNLPELGRLATVLEAQRPTSKDDLLDKLNSLRPPQTGDTGGATGPNQSPPSYSPPQQPPGRNQAGGDRQRSAAENMEKGLERLKRRLEIDKLTREYRKAHGMSGEGGGMPGMGGGGGAEGGGGEGGGAGLSGGQYPLLTLRGPIVPNPPVAMGYDSLQNANRTAPSPSDGESANSESTFSVPDTVLTASTSVPKNPQRPYPQGPYASMYNALSGLGAVIARGASTIGTQISEAASSAAKAAAEMAGAKEAKGGRGGEGGVKRADAGSPADPGDGVPNPGDNTPPQRGRSISSYTASASGGFDDGDEPKVKTSVNAPLDPAAAAQVAAEIAGGVFPAGGIMKQLSGMQALLQPGKKGQGGAITALACKQKKVPAVFENYCERQKPATAPEAKLSNS